MNIMERLRAQTKKLHIRAHELPFFKALLKRKLPIECYVGQLRSLAIIHETLESETQSSDHPAIRLIWNGYMPKFPLIIKDISHFEHLKIGDIVPATREAMSISDKIILRKKENPVSLLGYIYTLEGSTLGGKVIKPMIADTFGLKDSEGVLFFDSYGENIRSNWQSFSQRMLQAVSNKADEESIIEASYELFEGLLKVYENLLPEETI